MAKASIDVVRRWTWSSAAGLPIAAILLWLTALAGGGGAALLYWSLETAVRGLWPLVAGAALALLPGLAVLQLLWPAKVAAWPERLCLAWCTSMALPPLLLELAALIRLPWRTAATAGYLLVAAVLLGWLRYRARGLRRERTTVEPWHVLGLVGLLLVALMTRLFAVRDLPVGMWGDSYHHTMMAQLLVDNGGLFTSWEPYAPLATFTYHFGFHANVAFFHWLSGVPVTQSLLLVGQTLSVATIAGAYVLTLRLTGSRVAALFACALTGFGGIMPAYYVNWGRYTQLDGQVVLAAVLLAWSELLELPRWNWRRVGLAGVLTACLILTHYIVTILAAMFVLAYIIVLLARAPDRVTVLRIGGHALLSAGLALLLTIPWLANTLGSYLIRNTAGFVSQEIGADRVAVASNLVAIPPFFVGWPILALAFVGLFVALRRRSWRTTLFAGWTLALIVAVVPQVLGLPGTGVVENFTSYIALYITVVPLAAYALGGAHELLSRWRPGLARAAAVLSVIGLSAWGMSWQQRMIEPQYQLFTTADSAAMQWIREHTPADATFHVNMFPAYGGTLFAGSDGGWWIPLLTKRESTLPPITYGSERGAAPDYSQRVNEFGYALQAHPLPDPEGIAALRRRGVDYVYVGAVRGASGSIDVTALRASPDFGVVYDQDGVVIFELQPAP